MLPIPSSPPPSHDDDDDDDDDGKHKGRFVRAESVYRDVIGEDHPVFKPEKGRYHLYISYACPWANRCLTTLYLKVVVVVMVVVVVIQLK